MARPRKYSFADPKKRYSCACGGEMKYTSLGTHLRSKKHIEFVGSRFPFKVERNVVFHFTPEGERHWEASQGQKGRMEQVPSLSSVPVLEQEPHPSPLV